MSDPALPEARRHSLTSDLMTARRAVAAAQRANDADALAAARAAVQAAKVALGERGPVWWNDGAPDYNRHMAKNTPYAGWHAGLETPATPAIPATPSTPGAPEKRQGRKE